jgi:hypothetical protein
LNAANDLARWLMRRGAAGAAWAGRLLIGYRQRSYGWRQRKLARRYGIGRNTPILSYEGGTRERVEAYILTQGSCKVATTSGTTGLPKRIAFPKQRMLRFKTETGLAGAAVFTRLGLMRIDLFALASPAKDDSFSDLTLNAAEGGPSYIAGLVYPSRYLQHPALKGCAERYGITAARLWLMAVCNPGIIYSTNPSTLAVFLQEVQSCWEASSALARDWCSGEADLDRTGLCWIASRVGSRGMDTRLERIAATRGPPPIGSILPGLRAYCCWDGGYVGLYLEQIRRLLPAEEYLHIPMYSMSTETLQTLPSIDGGRLRYLPLAGRLRYEFLAEGEEELPENLLEAGQLECGQAYSLVASDPYGLLRYQTGDVFLCKDMAAGLPDLRFLRRRGLSWSFTGEKVTGEQLQEAFGRLRKRIPGLEGAQMTCIPSHPGGDSLPGYRLLAAKPGGLGEHGKLAEDFDAALAELNPEYREKRASGRLAPPIADTMSFERAAAALDSRQGSADSRGWESQFKLAPLTLRLWEGIPWS